MLYLMCINIHCRKVYYAFGIPVHDYCVNILPTHEVMYASKCIIVFSSQTHLKMTRKGCWNKQHTTTNTSDYITQCWCETPKYKIYTTYTTRFVTNTSATVNICYLDPPFAIWFSGEQTYYTHGPIIWSINTNCIIALFLPSKPFTHSLVLYKYACYPRGSECS